jgi:ribose transport system substrate-binding protein
MVAGNPPAEKTILIESVLVTRDSVKDYAGW